MITPSGEMTLRLWWPSLLLWSPTLIQMQLVQFLNAWSAKEIAKLRINESYVHIFEISDNENPKYMPYEVLRIVRVITSLIIRGKVPLMAEKVLLKVPYNRKPILRMVGPPFLIALVFSLGRWFFAINAHLQHNTRTPTSKLKLITTLSYHIIMEKYEDDSHYLFMIAGFPIHNKIFISSSKDNPNDSNISYKYPSLIHVNYVINN